MQKIVSVLTILAALSVGAFDALASSRAEPVSLPKVSDVLPDPLPLDMSNAPSLRAPSATSVQTTQEIVIVAPVWTCGESRPLATDPVMTYRECEYR